MEFGPVRKKRSVLTWMSIVGTRPQFVKLAPVCRAIEAFNEQGKQLRVDHCIVNTEQHYDPRLAKLLFTQMEIPEPNYHLAAGSGSHGIQIARMLGRLEPILISKCPDWVIVYGDTNSALAGALLAARLKLPIAHVEAGCRSDDAEMPEEQNRIVADHLSRLLLAPSQRALRNLHREGIGGENDPQCRRAVVVGDVMHDALLQNLKIADSQASEHLQQLGLRANGYYLLTLHRAENTDRPERLRAILEAVGTLDTSVLFPVHPRTRHALESARIPFTGNLRPIEPLGYLEMLTVAKHAKRILTDSGGIQKEAFYLKVPCVTLRTETEWPETVELGANCIAGNTVESIREALNTNPEINWSSAMPYGDGKAAERIVEELSAHSTGRSSVNSLQASPDYRFSARLASAAKGVGGA